MTELSENPGLNATGPPALGDIDAESWAEAVAALRSTPARPPPPPWDLVFGPLARGAVDDVLVVGQIGQSLDGRIATPTGHSHYVNGEDGLVHLHRLRALVDAVVVGVGTVVADDPQLTVRRVAGPQPARVVIDPKGRLPTNARALAVDGMRRLVIVAAERQPSLPAGVEIIALDNSGGAIEPAAIVGSLAQRGLRRILVEGGARTISRFLAAGCLDRLHVVVAPVILGAGPAGIALPPIDRMDEALRPRMQAHMLGDEVLFDCDLSAQRVPIGRAKKST